LHFFALYQEIGFINSLRSIFFNEINGLASKLKMARREISM